jgi:1-aminocyclopropane-1-carboxylate deaminase/D-cysteine desulfhydrase-like pyridoxal-dependent ACC family enzyme
MTAAAGAVLGLEVHLVMSGDRPAEAAGNQLLSALFGAQMHFTGADDTHWGELEIAREQLTRELAAAGLAPYGVPIGGSTPTGAAGYALALDELLDQCDAAGFRPAAVVHTSSSGGTHAGLVAGKALLRASGREVPEVLAIGVAKGVNMGMPDVVDLARDTIELLGGVRSDVERGDVSLDPSWIGDDYGVPTRAGDAAIRWAARQGGWVLDRTYSGKGFAGLVGNVEAGRWAPGSDVVFVHTGGTPALFAPGGFPGGVVS